MRLFRKNLLFIVVFISLILVILSLFSFPEYKIIVIFGFVLFLFAFLLCYQIEKNIQIIFEKIISFFNIISEGKSDKHTLDRSFDYLNPAFSSTFGDIATKLDNVFSELKKEKNELEAILDAMSEGVIVVSGKGAVALVNKSATSMFQLAEEYVDKPYWEVLRNRQLQELVSDTLRNQKGLKKEINIVYPEAKYYLANTILLDKPSEEIITVIFDMTEFNKLEKIKADFIANVSHELRTPLTSIKGYAETIEDGAYSNEKERSQFLKIITQNTDRLISIVSDLLILSELEGKYSLSLDNSSQNFEKTSVNEIIVQTLASLRRKIREKQIHEKIDLEDDLPPVYGIKFFLEQMFTNLIDNAIKYNKCGGEMKINSYSSEDAVVIKIADTGIGILKEHQDRIFERFYRVDKNRSREIGGTGLGLSIVKHIVLVHNGTITLDSEKEKGSEFTIELPINKKLYD